MKRAVRSVSQGSRLAVSLHLSLVVILLASFLLVAGPRPVAHESNVGHAPWAQAAAERVKRALLPHRS